MGPHSDGHPRCSVRSRRHVGQTKQDSRPRRSKPLNPGLVLSDAFRTVTSNIIAPSPEIIIFAGSDARLAFVISRKTLQSTYRHVLDSTGGCAKAYLVA